MALCGAWLGAALLRVARAEAACVRSVRQQSLRTTTVTSWAPLRWQLALKPSRTTSRPRQCLERVSIMVCEGERGGGWRCMATCQHLVSVGTAGGRDPYLLGARWWQVSVIEAGNQVVSGADSGPMPAKVQQEYVVGLHVAGKLVYAAHEGLDVGFEQSLAHEANGGERVGNDAGIGVGHAQRV